MFLLSVNIYFHFLYTSKLEIQLCKSRCLDFALELKIFYTLNRIKRLSFNRCLQVWKEEKSAGAKSGEYTNDYGFIFWQKLTWPHSDFDEGNPLFVFPQFCAFLANCFAQSPHNFKAAFLIYLISRLTWPLIDKRRTNQILGLICDLKSTTVAVLTGYCIMGRHAEKIRLPFNDFCHGCRYAEEKETFNHFVCYFTPNFLSAWRSYHRLISRL